MLLLLACASETITEGTYAFSLVEIRDDTCGIDHAQRDDVSLSLTKGGFETTSENGQHMTYTVDKGEIEATAFLEGNVIGEDCTFDIDVSETGQILDESTFELTEERLLIDGVGNCPLPIPCEMTMDWRSELQ